MVRFGIIDALDFTILSNIQNGLWVFSDRRLHSQLNVERVATLHSIMPFTVPKAPEEVKETFRKALFMKLYLMLFHLKPHDIKGKTSGELVGETYLFCIVC